MPRQPIRAHLRYSIEHEWIDTSATPSRIGITAVAADALGEVVFVDLPEVGAAVQAGEVCGELESTKAVSDLYSPVTGTVASLNEAAVDDPGVISTDPYGEGWLFTVEVAGEGELLSPEEYAERFDAEIDLAISIDPDVIGGFVLRAGSTAVDATVRTRLADARARIAV